MLWWYTVSITWYTELSRNRGYRTMQNAYPWNCICIDAHYYRNNSKMEFNKKWNLNLLAQSDSAYIYPAGKNPSYHSVAALTMHLFHGAVVCRLDGDKITVEKQQIADFAHPWKLSIQIKRTDSDGDARYRVHIRSHPRRLYLTVSLKMTTMRTCSFAHPFVKPVS